MNEGSTESGDAGHHHWKPVTPVSAMIVGRLVLGLPSAAGLTVIVLVQSTLTRARLGLGRARVFSLVAVAIREFIDALAHRPIMRTWRSRDPHGLLLTIITTTYPAAVGFLAAHLLVPASTTALTALTWLPFMAFVAPIEKPQGTSLGYDALQKRIHQPQSIPPEYVAADFHDARKYLPEFRRIAQAHAMLQPTAPATSIDLNCDDDHGPVRARERHL